MESQLSWNKPEGLRLEVYGGDGAVDDDDESIS
jgi:hypothetical protein